MCDVLYFTAQQHVAMGSSWRMCVCVSSFHVPSGVIIVRRSPISHWKAHGKYHPRLHICINNPSLSVQIWSPSLKIHGLNSFEIYTETKMTSFCWKVHHWLHWKLSFWQLPVQPKMEVSSKWRHFRMGVWVWIIILHHYWRSPIPITYLHCYRQRLVAEFGDKLSSVVYQTMRCDQRWRSLVAFMLEPMLFFTLFSFMWLIRH